LPGKTGGFFENYTWNQQGSNRIAESMEKSMVRF